MEVEISISTSMVRPSFLHPVLVNGRSSPDPSYHNSPEGTIPLGYVFSLHKWHKNRPEHAIELQLQVDGENMCADNAVLLYYLLLVLAQYY